jgi:hypothetical protein
MIACILPWGGNGYGVAPTSFGSALFTPCPPDLLDHSKKES